MPVHVFVGPTLAAQDVVAAVPNAIVHPPVAHGDLLRLDLGPEDTAVIIDGFFHQAPPLRHKEILWILARQVRVVGCSSIGALRAAELWPYGMIGNGVVFRMYRDAVIDADDEVAVSHGEAPGYRTFGEPLVNFRHAVATAERNGVVTVSEADDIVAAFRELHYTVRSWRAIQTEPVARVRQFLSEHPEHADIKAADAIDTLTRLAEFDQDDSALDLEWASSSVWKNRLLHEWLAEFTTSPVEGIEVSHAMTMQFQQIYRPDFPRRWSAFALRGTSGRARPDLDENHLSHEQRAEWLTPHETTALTPAGALSRIVIRSHRPPRGIFDLVTGEPDLVDDPAARAAVAESAVVNAEVAGWGARQGIEFLKLDVLRDHLGAIWQADDEAALVAAARDRGFGSVLEAAEAARPFFLRHRMVVEDADGPS